MEQQDAKSLISLEQFLSNLEVIIDSFKTYVNSTNKRIDDLSQRFNTLLGKVNDNTKAISEVTRMADIQAQIITKDITGGISKSNEDLIKEIKELQKMVSKLNKQATNIKEPAPSPKTNKAKRLPNKPDVCRNLE
mgnify:CR=1 FL=1